MQVCRSIQSWLRKRNLVRARNGILICLIKILKRSGFNNICKNECDETPNFRSILKRKLPKPQLDGQKIKIVHLFLSTIIFIPRTIS